MSFKSFFYFLNLNLYYKKVTYPLDITKTRLQIQGELGKNVKKRGMIKMAVDIGILNQCFIR